MFVFRNDESTIGKENRAVPANKFFSDAVLAQTKKNLKKYDGAPKSISDKNADDGEKTERGCLAASMSSALNLSASTEYSTELSNFSLNSDDSGSSMDSSYDADEEESVHPTLSNVLYKPSFDSPVDRLLRATNPATPKRQAMDIFHQLQTWVTIEAQMEEIETYSWEIRNRAIPELLEFIRYNVDDKECVSEALNLIQTLASLSEIDPQSQTSSSSSSTKAMLLIESQAINVLVLALLSHNNNLSNTTTANNSHHHTPPSHMTALQQQQHQPKTCLFQRLWNFLMEIILCPSSVYYFQRCHKRQQQKHHQRMRLITAVDLCLDRLMHFSASSVPSLTNHSYLKQIFKTLTMLLRTQTKEGNPKPNETMRLMVWEKQIVLKCQQLMAHRMDAADWETFEGFPESQEQQEECQNNSRIHETERDLAMDALLLFEIFLCDHEDGLSESVDGAALENYVYNTLPKFPLSVSIQTKGCQILNDVASKQSRSVTALPTGDQIFLSLAASANESKQNRSSNDDEHTTSQQSIKENIDKDVIVEEFGPKEKISLIHLVKTFFQKPCLCENLQDFQVKTSW